MSIEGELFRALAARSIRYVVIGVELAVARLEHIVSSKAAAGRDKDDLFLKTYRQVLGELIQREESARRRSGRAGPDLPDSPA